MDGRTDLARRRPASPRVHPAGEYYSLTDNPGFLRYSLDPMTHPDGFLNGYATTFSYHSCCNHDAGLEIHRAFSGDNWRFEAGGNFFLPFTNGRAFVVSLYFGTGAVPTYWVRLTRGADVNQNYVSLGLFEKTGPALADQSTLQGFQPNGNWYYGVNNYPTAPLFFRLERAGGVLRAYWSDDGVAWNAAWSHDLGSALDGLDQRVVVTGLSWFSTGGSFADWDYISVTPTVLPPEEQVQAVCDDLQAIADANPGTPLADKVEDALAKCRTAFAELTKSPPDRQAAAGAIEGAVGELEAAVASGLLAPAEGNEIMDDFAGVARQIAQEAIDEAIAGVGATQ